MRSDRRVQALLDIRDNILLARSFAGELTEEGFAQDHKTFYAVTRCLEIISEASRKIPDEIKVKHPQMPWKEIAGAGNIYRHDYGNVTQSLVWITLHKSLPPLLKAVESELVNPQTP